MTSGLPESRFHMWRAVIAMMHADHIVKPHEINFILEHTRPLPMSAEQRSILKEDLSSPPSSIDDLFDLISSPIDREDFFHLARALAWADGHFDEREQALLIRLKGTGWTGMEETRQDFIDYVDNGAGNLRRHDPVVLGMIRSLMGRAA